MQHPDEGKIHSWLDGALAAEEAASLETHVATCQPCAAAVAEARGFIAASSRILTALDDVPRGVVPAVPARKRDLRVFWRAAAAMLVVAGGSLVVMREGGPDAGVATSMKTRAVPTAVPPAAPENQATTGSGGSVTQADESAISESPLPPSPARANRAPVATERDLSAQATRRQATSSAGAVTGGTVVADAVVPSNAAARIAANAPAAENETPLRILRVGEVGRSRQTTYEIAPGQTVTLTEQEPARPLAAPVTSAQAAAEPQVMMRGARTVQPSRVEAAPASPPPPPMMDARTGADSVVAAGVTAMAKSPIAQRKAAAAFTAPLRTITWADARTGKTLVLTGSVSVERLQEIRLRIDKQRAAGITAP